MIQKKENYDNVDVILKKIRIQNKLDFYLSSKSIYVKEDIQEILEYFIVSLYNLGKEDVKYLNGIDIVQSTINKLNSNSNFDMCIDNMLWRLWEEVNENNSRS